MLLKDLKTIQKEYREDSKDRKKNGLQVFDFYIWMNQNYEEAIYKNKTYFIDIGYLRSW